MKKYLTGVADAVFVVVDIEWEDVYCIMSFYIFEIKFGRLSYVCYVLWAESMNKLEHKTQSLVRTCNKRNS